METDTEGKRQRGDNYWRGMVMTIVSSAVVVFAGAWVQINSRISVLEVQVENDHEMYMQNVSDTRESMERIRATLEAINLKVTHLTDTKQDIGSPPAGGGRKNHY